jgi:hypothetical protein
MKTAAKEVRTGGILSGDTPYHSSGRSSGSAEPGTFVDGLTDVLRKRARKLLTQVVEAEVEDLFEQYYWLATLLACDEGRQRIVRPEHLPEHDGHRSGRCARSPRSRPCGQDESRSFLIDDRASLRTSIDEPRPMPVVAGPFSPRIGANIRRSRRCD